MTTEYPIHLQTALANREPAPAAAAARSDDAEGRWT